MFDFFKSLPKDSKVLVVSVEQMEFNPSPFKGDPLNNPVRESLEELKALLETLGLVAAQEYIQPLKKINPATYLGSGRLKDLSEKAKAEDIKIIVFDCELKPGQLRNIKELTKLDVYDRYYIILEIFERHARTQSAKLQIEMAKLEYLLPRLSLLWSHFSRQRGASGMGVMGGEGEQQIELDRRMIRNRISKLKLKLEKTKTSQREKSKKRRQSALIAALVGRTNAGKSTIFNGLCQEKVLAKDQLFSTLDTTHRKLTPQAKPPMLLIDTVGIIANLPTTLVNGFKTTLESVREAQIVIHVVDVSHPLFEEHLKMGEDFLDDLLKDEQDSPKERIICFNKEDLLESPLTLRFIKKKYPNHVLVSATNPESVKNFKHQLVEKLLALQSVVDLFVPYEDGKVHATIEGLIPVIERNEHREGIYYRLQTEMHVLQKHHLTNYMLNSEEQKALR